MDRQFRYLIIILILGTFFRFFWIDKSPPSLNWDEVAHGYNAYSIMETGEDEWGYKFPVLLRSFDDYKPALYAYLTIPFIFLFGLNEFSVRAVSALSGILIILLIYLIAGKFFKNKNIALISALLISIEPWSVLFSRAAYEANLALAILLFGIYLSIKSELKNNLAILGFALITFSSYAYHSEKIFFPLVIVSLLIVYKKNVFICKKIIIKAIAISLVLIIPLVFVQFNERESLGRLGTTSILKATQDQGLTGIGEQVFKRYLSYFSPANLFVRGTPEPTQNIIGYGTFYTFEFVFWVVGMVLLFKNIRKQLLLFLLITLSPVPAIITWNWFYPHRVLPFFAFNSIVIAWGIHYTYSKFKVKLIWAGAILYFSINVALMFTTLLFYMPYVQRGAWQYGMKQIINTMNNYQEDYNEVVIETRTAQPHIFVLFYTKYPPAKYHEEISELAKSKNPRKSFDFGKYIFRDVYWPKDQYKNDILLVGPESSLPQEKVSESQLVHSLVDFEGNIITKVVGLE